jgi:hypothetical protein
MLVQSGAKRSSAVAMNAFEAHQRGADPRIQSAWAPHRRSDQRRRRLFGKHVNLAARVASKATGGDPRVTSARELTASGGQPS